MKNDMPTKVMKLKDIIPAEYNPRQDLQKGDFEYDRLKDSIDKLGFVKPLVVNSRNNVLISLSTRCETTHIRWVCVSTYRTLFAESATTLATVAAFRLNGT